MKGFPKHLNTKSDYLYIRNKFPENQWKPEFQKLIDERFNWLNIKTLKPDEAEIIDETHRIKKIEDENKNIIEKYQQEYKEDENAKLFQIGFTVNEINEIINISGK